MQGDVFLKRDVFTQQFQVACVGNDAPRRVLASVTHHAQPTPRSADVLDERRGVARLKHAAHGRKREERRLLELGMSASLPRRPPRDKSALDLPYALTASLPRPPRDRRPRAQLHRAYTEHAQEAAHAHAHASRRHSVDSDIIEHLAECRCPCEHLGYSSYQDEAALFPPDVTRGDNKEAAAFFSQTSQSPASSMDSEGGGGACAGRDFPAVGKMPAMPRPWTAVIVVLVLSACVGVSVPIALRVSAGASIQERLELVTRLLREVPLIDGHNDLPWNIRKFLHNRLEGFRFGEDLRGVQPWSQSAWSHTDLPRLRAGLVGAQIWAAYVPCETHFRDAVQLTLEQVDVIRRLTEKFQPALTLCTSAAEIEAAHAQGQVCSLISVEGGHSLGSSLPVLRTLYAVGVRGLTLTSTCNTPWADSSLSDDPGRRAEHGGLTSFGKSVVREMNRLGMLVDLSHVSEKTMRAALAETRAPALFSHSSARALCNSSRNVPDHILRLVKRNQGLVMVNFYSHFLTCKEESTVADAIAHINHVRDVAGVDCVGLGAGYDGINVTPRGLEDVSSYPLLLAHLLADGWNEIDLMKLAGRNFLRVLRHAETVRDAMRVAGVGPIEDDAPRRKPDNCSSPYLI